MRDAKYEPNSTDLGQLIGVLKHPGYEVLVKIFESEIDQLQLDMLNADPLNEKEVLAKHNLALSAGVFYQRVINHLHELSQKFNNAPKRGEILKDPTEALFQ